MDLQEKLQWILDHPRKSAVKNQYPIGSVVEDQEVINYEMNDPRKGVCLRCRCLKCGREKIITKNCLDNKIGTSHKACGQYLKTKDQEFHSKYKNMRTRINNPNYDHYDRYGGRNLTCEYDSFIDFYDDLYESFVEHRKKYGIKNTTLDRIDNNKGYIKNNLKWSTQKEQVNNSTKIGKPFCAISPEGKSYFGRNQSDFANEHLLSSKQINAVLKGRFKTTQGWKFNYLDNEVENESVTTIEKDL